MGLVKKGAYLPYAVTLLILTGINPQTYTDGW